MWGQTLPVGAGDEEERLRAGKLCSMAVSLSVTEILSASQDSCKHNPPCIRQPVDNTNITFASVSPDVLPLFPLAHSWLQGQTHFPQLFWAVLRRCVLCAQKPICRLQSASSAFTLSSLLPCSFPPASPSTGLQRGHLISGSA